MVNIPDACKKDLFFVIPTEVRPKAQRSGEIQLWRFSGSFDFAALLTARSCAQDDEDGMVTNG